MIKPKTALLVGIFLLVLLGISVAVWKKPSAPPLTTREVTVTRGTLETTILSTGDVQPKNRVQIIPPISGRVEKVLVDEGDPVKKGQVLAWMSSTERAALLDAARARGPEELKHWEEMYRATPILAPINGTIIIRNVESGQTLTSQDAMFDMSDRLTVKARVDETDIAYIKLKQKAEIILDAYPETIIAAHVDQIAYDAETVNNVTTYVVDIIPEETPAVMRSGMTANVSFVLERKVDVLVIPNEAVTVQNDQSIVLVPAAPGKANGKKAERIIQTGISDGKQIEVISGLSEGEKIFALEYRVAGSKGSPTGQSNPFSPFGHGKRGK